MGCKRDKINIFIAGNIVTRCYQANTIRAGKYIDYHLPLQVINPASKHPKKRTQAKMTGVCFGSIAENKKLKVSGEKYLQIYIYRGGVCLPFEVTDANLPRLTYLSLPLTTYPLLNPFPFPFK